MSVRFSGNPFVSINEVTIRRARLAYTWMGDRLRAGKPSRHATAPTQPGHPSAGIDTIGNGECSE